MATTIYSAIGSYIWVCPANVFSVQIESQGTGARGGGCGSGGGGAGGGGGGAYARKNAYTTIPGQSYNIVVGSRDVYGNGLPSSFIYSGVYICKADGGTYGQNGAGGTPGAGGNGGQASNCIGDVKYDGGNGANGGAYTGGGGGSSAGTSSAGNNGSGNTGGAAVAGGGPGGNGGVGVDGSVPPYGPGGGGGGGGDYPTAIQANGYDGQVIITYTLPLVSYSIPKATLSIAGHAPTISLYSGRAFSIPKATLSFVGHAPSLTFTTIYAPQPLVKWPRPAWNRPALTGAQRLSELTNAELAALTNAQLSNLEN